MSEHPLSVTVSIEGHGDITLTIEPETISNICLTTPGGALLAALSLSNINAPRATLGHWPDGEQWEEQASVSLTIPAGQH